MRFAVEAIVVAMSLFFWMMANQAPRVPRFLCALFMAALGALRRTMGCN